MTKNFKILAVLFFIREVDSAAYYNKIEKAVLYVVALLQGSVALIIVYEVLQQPVCGI